VEKGVAEEKNIECYIADWRLPRNGGQRLTTSRESVPGLMYTPEYNVCKYVSMASSPPAFVVSTLTHSWDTSANGTHDPRLPSLPADIISVTDCLSSLLYIHPKGIAAIFPS